MTWQTIYKKYASPYSIVLNVKDIIKTIYFSMAATPGNTLPSINSSIAPPPVDT